MLKALKREFYDLITNFVPHYEERKFNLSCCRQFLTPTCLAAGCESPEDNEALAGEKNSEEFSTLPASQDEIADTVRLGLKFALMLNKYIA